MKRNIIILALFAIASFNVKADLYDDAIAFMTSIDKVNVTTISRPMLSSMNLPFSSYNLETIKQKMNSMTVIDTEGNLSKVRNCLKDASKQSGYSTALHQKDEDGEYTKIIVRSASNDTFNRIIFIIDDIDDITFVSIDGNFSESDIGSIMKKRATKGVINYKSYSISLDQDQISPMDTTGLTPEQKQALIKQKKQLYEQYMRGAEQYKQGLEQYKRGMEQFENAMKQYEDTQKEYSDKAKIIRHELNNIGVSIDTIGINNDTIIIMHP